MFANLRKSLQAILEVSGFSEPTEVQEKTVPLFLAGNDLYVQASTGAGKTLSYLIPLLNMIEPMEHRTRALIIAPTRELAVQIEKTASEFAGYMKLHTVCLVGGLLPERQISLLKHYPEIVIGTAGRILDMITQGYLKTEDLRYLVLDEADMLLGLGQRKELAQIMDQLPPVQTAMFSATMNDSLTALFPGKYETVIINEAAVQIHTRQFYLITDDPFRTFRERFISDLPCSTMVFVPHISECRNYAAAIHREGLSAEAVHSNLQQKKRMQIIRNFNAGEISYLVTTDACARGLDIEGVGTVIHIGLPFDEETYIHRCGRAAHQGGNGNSFLILSQAEAETELGRKLISGCTELTEDTIVPDVILKPMIRPDIRLCRTWRIQGGTDQKIRKKDVAGALSALMPFETIGAITILDHYTEVTVNSPDPLPSQIKVKGKLRTVREYDDLPF